MKHAIWIAVLLVAFGAFADERFLFINSERSSVTFVYSVADPAQPHYRQLLPAAAGPEGALAIPARGLLVSASEEDNRGDKLRSAINIYQYGADRNLVVLGRDSCLHQGLLHPGRIARFPGQVLLLRYPAEISSTARSGPVRFPWPAPDRGSV